MDKLILRRATSVDLEDIHQLQLDVFHGEQSIPSAMIPLAADQSPKWWCALVDSVMVGAVAAWEVNHEMHWGRFATRKEYRGMQIGTKLARFSLDDLFSQQVKDIYMDARDATVNIICKMGGEVVGESTPFYEGTVTPMILNDQAFLGYKTAADNKL